MRNGMRSIHVVWGGWALGIRAGNWPSNHPTQWLDSAPCAAYFACHAKKSYFPGLNTEMDLACYSHFLTFILQHGSATINMGVPLAAPSGHLSLFISAKIFS